MPEQLRKYRVSYDYLSGSPEQSQSYQASMQILAIPLPLWTVLVPRVQGISPRGQY